MEPGGEYMAGVSGLQYTRRCRIGAGSSLCGLPGNYWGLSMLSFFS